MLGVAISLNKGRTDLSAYLGQQVMGLYAYSSSFEQLDGASVILIFSTYSVDELHEL